MILRSLNCFDSFEVRWAFEDLLVVRCRSRLECTLGDEALEYWGRFRVINL